MPRISHAIALALTSSLLLAGCSGVLLPPTQDPTSVATQSPAPGASTPVPEASSESDNGLTLEGSGYTFVIPQGWIELDPKLVSGISMLEVVGVSQTPTNGFSNNVNVVASPSGPLSSQQFEVAGTMELEAVGAIDVRVRDRVWVAGAESAHLSAVLTESGLKYHTEQYALANGKNAFVVTFSFGYGTPESERDALSNSVLATWTWK